MRFAKVGLALVLLGSGCKARDGDILMEVCRKTGQKAAVLAGTAAAPSTTVLHGSAGEISVAGRVQNRIRWDRYLSNLQIEVRTTTPGVVALQGKSPDLAIKQRILDLAKATSGVEASRIGSCFRKRNDFRAARGSQRAKKQTGPKTLTALRAGVLFRTGAINTCRRGRRRRPPSSLPWAVRRRARRWSRAAWQHFLYTNILFY